MTFRTSIMLCAAAAVLLTVSCRSIHGSGTQTETAEKAEAVNDTNTITLSVEEVESSGIQTSPVVEGSVSETVSIQGRVIPRAGQQAPVFSPFPGRMVPPDGGLPMPGAVVKQGQLLGFVEQELSATEIASVNEKRIELDSQVEQTEREVTQKTRDLERARTLYEGGVIALKQLQQAETDLHTAEARRTAAQRARAGYNALVSSNGPRRINIAAPISGKIMAVNVAPGQRVDPAKSLFEIADLATVWIEARVFEEYLARVRNART
ncbi:MAG TPA: efflux RND transporter periplasmic adaptor subunit, partial [Blastocatellia bacterium]|nr:efflux RND transporter periplasmic adaptor subunit [Blastocatellia bacterium]